MVTMPLDPDGLTLGELAELDTLLGGEPTPIDVLLESLEDVSTVPVLTWRVWLAAHREDPTFTVEDAGLVPFTVVMEQLQRVEPEGGD